MGFDIAFWVLAVIAIAAALTVVSISNVFRAALALIVSFLAIAALYITLSADFLAVAQVLIYVGGISILIIVAIMLTRDVQHGSTSNKLAVPAFLVALLFMGVVGFTLLNTPWPVTPPPPLQSTVGSLGNALVGKDGFILPVEIGALLLLVAILGAIVLVREK